MKKIMLALGLMFATLTLTNCSNEIDENINSNNTNKEFAIFANIPDTKTTIDGMETSWAAGDALTLFHYDGETYTYDASFTNSEENLNKFEGAEPVLDAETEYTWYAIYPANTYNSSKNPTYTAYDNVGYASYTQDGYNSTAHVCGEKAPLWGKVAKEAGDYTVHFDMHHLCAMLAIKVTNTTGDAIVVNSASFTSDQQDFVGTYHLDLTGEKVAYTSSGADYVYNTATVTVNNATDLADGETAILYMPIKPFANVAGETFTLSVVTNNGTATKTLTLADANTAVFEAGIIKPLTISIDALESNAIELPWEETFDSDDLSAYVLTNGGGTTKWYNEQQASGDAAGEILIAKNKGTMTAQIASDGTARTLYFSFKANYATRVGVSSTNEDVSITKHSDNVYTLNLTAGVSQFDITLTNTNTSSNVRVDDILLTAEAPTIESISVSGATTTYNIGDTFEFDGSVIALYTNGVEEDVTTDAYIDKSSVDMGISGDYDITVTYGEFSTTYTITVKEDSTDGGEGSIILSEAFDDTTNSDSSAAITTSKFTNFSGATDKAYTSKYGGIKLGTSSKTGYITTKSLDLSSDFTVQIDACKYGSDTGNIVVTVGDQTQTIKNADLKAAGTFTTYTLSFSAATATSTVKIATSAKRAYIDNVVITKY